MTSILTNTSASSAIQVLRAINSNLAATQGQASAGLRIRTAADNAAYWSISTTMRSDKMSISAVADALGLGAAKVDTAYAGMEAVIDVLREFKAKLVAAKEPGVDKAKVQSELDQLKQMVVSIATSSGFGGQNWLNTDIGQIYDLKANKVSLVSSFSRSSGSVSIGTIDLHLDEISLFNTAGGGLLQADPRDVKTIGGMRYGTVYPESGSSTIYYTETGSSWMNPTWNSGAAGTFSFNFPHGSPLDFNSPGAEIKFDIILDREYDPSGDTGITAELRDLPGPYDPGHTKTITITKAHVDAYDASLGGIISTNTQFAGLLNTLLNPEGAHVNANYGHYQPPGSNNWIHDDVLMSVETRQMHGNGSYVEIANLSSVGVSTGGLTQKSDYGERGSGLSLQFDPFTLHIDGDTPDGVEVSFQFSINGAPSKSYEFNRTYVNNLLGKDTGAIETADEMVTLLRSLLDADWPDTVIQVSSADPSKIIVKSDPAVDRKWGAGTRAGFSDIVVSIEPLPAINFLNIDIKQNPDLIDHYLNYIEVAGQRVVDGAAVLGALKQHIDMQSEFANKLMDTIDKGVGRLVDANMDLVLTRLKALQTQEQLAIQSLHIANNNNEAILQLFR
ncbi:flagellin N-terminal helical domain-containing protein [Ensifer sp. MJa1]|uniref:flagellin N-terminal helical domain-containing protein n=1 Tax=Ensifer sp. MJa1 TaxID=2919888 RepID=UPI003A138517